MDDALPILTAMLAPAAMITACGLLLLGIYNKHSTTFASLRRLNAEQRLITASVEHPGYSASETRQQQIMQENRLLKKRLQATLGQMRAILFACVLFLSASVGLGVGRVFHWHADSLVIVVMAAGLISLLVAMVLALVESGTIWHVLQAEMALNDETDSEINLSSSPAASAG